MSSSLPLLIVSLLAANPTSDLAPRSRGPSNAERAKMGLLPRRAAPSRVTYLAEAARSRADRRDFPEASAPPVVIEATADAPAAPAEPPAAAAPAASAQLAAEQAAPPTPAAPPAQLAVEQAAPVPEAPPARGRAAPPARVLPSQDEEPTPVKAAAAQVAAQLAAPAAVAPPRVAPQLAPARVSREYATESAALVTQRFVDEEGRIVVRLLGPKATVLAERFDGDVRNLPVRWAGRGEHGEIVEIVEDAWGPIEVRRDPVGRFLFARTVELGEE